jgi:nitroreductase
VKVSEALASRRSVRAFLDKPVEASVLRRVVEQAGRAPSGGNLQPWFLHLVTGEPLARFRATMAAALAANPTGEGAEYEVYPRPLPEVNEARRVAVGEAMYGALGIPREDRAARRLWFARNFFFFGAPVGLFCTVDRRMGPPQWSDLGMYLQSLMLLLREEDLDSCAQESWSIFPRTVGQFLGLPDEQMLFCGMAIGYRDPDQPVNRFATERAPLEEFATFRGFD